MSRLRKSIDRTQIGGEQGIGEIGSNCLTGTWYSLGVIKSPWK